MVIKDFMSKSPNLMDSDLSGESVPMYLGSEDDWLLQGDPKPSVMFLQK